MLVLVGSLSGSSPVWDRVWVTHFLASAMIISHASAAGGPPSPCSSIYIRLHPQEPTKSLLVATHTLAIGTPWPLERLRTWHALAHHTIPYHTIPHHTVPYHTTPSNPSLSPPHSTPSLPDPSHSTQCMQTAGPTQMPALCCQSLRDAFFESRTAIKVPSLY